MLHKSAPRTERARPHNSSATLFLPTLEKAPLGFHPRPDNRLPDAVPRPHPPTRRTGRLSSRLSPREAERPLGKGDPLSREGRGN